MKLVLKILALPVLFVVKVICILGNLLTNVVSYVIGCFGTGLLGESCPHKNAASLCGSGR